MAPIYKAAARGDVAEVKRLSIANPTLLEARLEGWLDINGDYAGEDSTPLFVASMCGHEEMVEWLLDQGADSQAVDEQQDTSHASASWEGHAAIVRILLLRGAGVNHHNLVRSTPLMSGHVEVIHTLVNHEGINLNLQDNSASTALYLSCDWGYQRITQPLLEKGADPTIALHIGRTPLDVARQGDHQECIALLDEALSQPIRVHHLHKLRSIHDAEHAISRALNEATRRIRGERRRRTVAAAPAFFKGRLEREGERPEVEVVEDRLGGEEEEVRAEVLKHMVMEGKIPMEVFIELMNIMLPKWDEERSRA